MAAKYRDVMSGEVPFHLRSRHTMILYTAPDADMLCIALHDNGRQLCTEEICKCATVLINSATTNLKGGSKALMRAANRAANQTNQPACQVITLT